MGSRVAGFFSVTQGVAGLHVLHAEHGDDVAGLGAAQFLARVGVHLDNTTDALGLAGKGVEHGRALFQLARVDTGKGQGAEAVVHDLEGQRAQRSVGIDDGEFAGLVAFQVDFRLGLDFRRVGQVVDHGVQHQLHALVLERGTAVGREEVQGDGALADAAFEFVDGGLFTFQVFLHQVVVLLDGGLDQFFTPFFDGISHVGRRFLDLVGGGVARVIPHPGLARQQVDHAFEVVFDADGQRHDQRAGGQYVLDLLTTR